ncbi:LCP family protein [Candidatus Ventrimonas sp. KK005]
MSREYDEELGYPERKSRRNPRMTRQAGEEGTAGMDRMAGNGRQPGTAGTGGNTRQPGTLGMDRMGGNTRQPGTAGMDRMGGNTRQPVPLGMDRMGGNARQPGTAGMDRMGGNTRQPVPPGMDRMGGNTRQPVPPGMDRMGGNTRQSGTAGMDQIGGNTRQPGTPGMDRTGGNTTRQPRTAGMERMGRTTRRSKTPGADSSDTGPELMGRSIIRQTGPGNAGTAGGEDSSGKGVRSSVSSRAFGGKQTADSRTGRMTGNVGKAQTNNGLRVMNDSSVHPMENRSSVQPRTSGRTATTGRRTAASQTAATAAAKGGGQTSGLYKKQQENAHRIRRRRIIGMIIAECFALLFMAGYVYVARLMNQVNRPVIDMEQVQNQDLDVVTMERLKGYWTIAIFGVDARDNSTINKSTNSDVNILCNINLETGEIKLVSLFRDTYLNLSKEGSYNKFNQAYFTGGPEQAMAAINRNLDLNVTDYATFNWKAVADAITILGGVDVELSKAEFYYINAFISETVAVTGIGSTQLTHAGMNHLDGVQAVAYGRLRLMDTDYARTERQRKVIKLAFDKAKTADYDTLNKVLGAVFPQISTNLGVGDFYTAIKNVNKYHIGETMGFPEARGDAKMGPKGACVIPQTLESNVVRLHEFLFGTENYDPSETVKSISKKIAADSGMYKEGNYVKSVNTDGGVIQPPKTTAAPTTKATEEEDDDEYEYIYVLNSSGKKVRKRIQRETDADGDYVKQETDEDGIATGWMLDADGELVRRKNVTNRDPSESSPETGAIIRQPTDENNSLNSPGSTESSGQRPKESTSGSSTTRPPLRPTDNTTAHAPNTRPSMSETDSHGRPVTPTTSGNNNGPGRPEESSPTRATDASNLTPIPAPSHGTTAANPGSPTTPTTASSNNGPGGAAPGSQVPGGPDSGNNGPGGQQSENNGPIAAPGM